MPTSRSKFVCSSCGYTSGKWYGRCPECGSWNTLEEVTISLPKRGMFENSMGDGSSEPQKIGSVKSFNEERISTSLEEFDRVLGGEAHAGIVPGSVILLSGDPGIGKSTLLLEIALKLSEKMGPILYISGEESESQVKMRAERLSGEKGHEGNDLFILSTTSINHAIEHINKLAPKLIIVDSIQTLGTTEVPGFPGSIPQIRYTTAKLVSIAKTKHIPVFLVGHVTKEGIVAGPMLLSHMVDTVLYLEGDLVTGTRILRAFKNRFGDTSEVGIFTMDERGLTEIKDASVYFIDKREEGVPGSCIAVIMEGTRPILIEVQALVIPSSLSFPRRVTSGIQEKRLEILLAVVQKHLKVPVDRFDIFVNVVGGMKVSEPGVDLAICLAVLSSFKNKTLRTTAAIGEIGLLGEIKQVLNLDKRVKEAKKMGLKVVLTGKSNSNLRLLAQKSGLL